MNTRSLLFILSALLTAACPVLAQEGTESGRLGANPPESALQWGGYLQSDVRFYRKYNHALSFQEYRLDLTAELKTSDKSHFYSELWIRSFGFPSLNKTEDLSMSGNIRPSNLSLREAYFDIYGFFVNSIDIRVGRQRNAWGSADKLNPTDNLDAYDLEDIYDFGRHFASDSIKASCYLGGFTLSLIYIPVFTPALLPRGDWLAVLFPQSALPTGLSVNSTGDKLITPANELRYSSSGGVRISRNILGYDLSLSYAYTRDSLPVLSRITLTPVSMLTPTVVDVSTELVYPVIQVAGADISGSIADFGFWAEAAMFIPRQVKLTTELQLPYPAGFVKESVSLSGHNYVKYVLGTDYTFRSGLYYNLQVVHGLFHERGESNLAHYFTIRFEYKLLDDKIKVAFLNGSVALKKFKDADRNYGYVYKPEISLYPADNAELILGAHLIDGTDSTIFGQLRHKDEFYVQAKYSF